MVIRYSDAMARCRCVVHYHGCILSDNADGASAAWYERLKAAGAVMVENLSKVVEGIEGPGLDYEVEHEMLQLRYQTEDPRPPLMRLKNACAELYGGVQASNNARMCRLVWLSDM